MNSKPSKSSRKRDAQAIDALARRLLALTGEQLAEVPLSDELRAAVIDTRKMTARSALRRQRLFLAGQLRQANAAEIIRVCESFDRQKLGAQKLFHQAERWRDRLLAERAPALTEFNKLTGRSSARLASLLEDLGRTLSDAQQRRVAREIFREIHAELAAKV